MNFRLWLEELDQVINVLNKGADGIYLALNNNRRFGPVESFKQIDDKTWIAKKKGSSETSYFIVNSPDFGMKISQKIEDIEKERKNQFISMQSKVQHYSTKGITVYRGIAGEYDPKYSKSPEQHWTGDLHIAYKEAINKSQHIQSYPTVLKAKIPYELIDMNKYGYNNKPTDKVTLHPASANPIFDIPNKILDKLNIEIVSQELLNTKYPDQTEIVNKLIKNNRDIWYLNMH